jgi:hypothetical protein
MGKFMRQVMLFTCLRTSFLPVLPDGLCSPSELVLLQYKPAFVKRQPQVCYERMGENAHLCVRMWKTECEFCVCRCLCSLRHEDPVCLGNSSGESIHVTFKSP